MKVNIPQIGIILHAVGVQWIYLGKTLQKYPIIILVHPKIRSTLLNRHESRLKLAQIIERVNHRIARQ